MQGNKILRYTLFNNSGSGHGGDRRTAQISEILDNAGVLWDKIPEGMDPPGIKRMYLGRLLKMIFLYFKVFAIIKRFPHPLRIYKTIRLTSQFTGIFNKLGEGINKLLLWEMTKSEYSFVVPLFKSNGFRIIAVPHNIESIVPERRSGITNRLSPEWIGEEISLLRLCDNIYTISEEDSEFLGQYGINSQCLPYFPNTENLKKLLLIRSGRLGNKTLSIERRKVLMLGSALNPPTMQGMKELLDSASLNNFDFCDLIVAGFGTEIFKKYHNGSTITVLGQLSQEKLDELLYACDKALINQRASSGALTRITEFLIAGIPVISNPDGARSFFGTDGIYIYSDYEQLRQFLSRDLPMPMIPEKPEIKSMDFIKNISSPVKQ